MLRACALDYASSWNHDLPLTEFAYSNNYHASIEMAPYEAMYGRQYRTTICWDKVGKRAPSKVVLIDQTREVVKSVRKRL